MPTAAARRRKRTRPKITKPTTPLGTLRLARTLLQGEMARLLRIKQQTYSRYETGEMIPPPDKRARIAAILGTHDEVLWPRLGVRSN